MIILVFFIWKVLDLCVEFFIIHEIHKFFYFFFIFINGNWLIPLWLNWLQNTFYSFNFELCGYLFYILLDDSLKFHLRLLLAKLVSLYIVYTEGTFEIHEILISWSYSFIFQRLNQRIHRVHHISTLEGVNATLTLAFRPSLRIVFL